VNTLQEIEAFTGVTSNAANILVWHFRRASPRSVAAVVPLLSGTEQSSMRSMIVGLQQQ
jgi:hypothetical protein